MSLAFNPDYESERQYQAELEFQRRQWGFSPEAWEEALDRREREIAELTRPLDG